MKFSSTVPDYHARSGATILDCIPFHGGSAHFGRPAAGYESGKGDVVWNTADLRMQMKLRGWIGYSRDYKGRSGPGAARLWILDPSCDAVRRFRASKEGR